MKYSLAAIVGVVLLGPALALDAFAGDPPAPASPMQTRMHFKTVSDPAGALGGRDIAASLRQG